MDAHSDPETNDPERRDRPNHDSLNNEIAITVLGVIGVSIGDNVLHLTDGDKRLLAMLVAAGPHGLSRSEAARHYSASDGSRIHETASQDTSPIRMAKSRLLRRLGSDSLMPAGGHFRLALGIGQVDLWRYTRWSAAQLIAEGKATLTTFFERQVFPELEPTELLESAELMLREARSEVLRRLTVDDIDGRLLIAISNRVQQDLIFRANDVEDAIHLLVGGGYRQEAHNLATRCRDEWRANGFGPAPLGVQRILAHSTSRPAPSTIAAFKPSPLPAFLARELDKPMVGRQGVREDLLASLVRGDAGAIVTGPMGSGKTRLLAEAARDLTSQGRRVVAFTADSNAATPLGQLALTFPELHTEIETVLQAVDEPDAAPNADLELLGAIERLGGEGACLIVDDGQWLDGTSMRLFDRIAASWVSKKWSLVVAGRPDPHAPGWPRFIAHLEHAGMRRIELEELSRTELSELVGVMYPTSGSLTRYNCATHLKHLGAGLPALARRRLEVQDPISILRSEIPKNAEPSYDWAVDVSERAAQAGSAAAVLGYTFSITELAALLELDTENTLSLLGELVEAGCVEELEDPRFLRFVHDLARVALLQKIPLAKRRELANQGAKIVSSPTVRARLLVDALPLSSTATTIEALEQVGLDAAASGSPDQAFAMFEQASRLRVDPPPPHVTLQHGIAAEQIGLDGAKLRRRSFDSYMKTGDYSGALHAVTAFELDLERLEPGHERLEMLHELEDSELDREDLLRLRCSLARALGMSGDRDQAQRQIRLAQDLARTPGERFAAWNAGWTTICRVRPDRWPELEVAVSELTSLDAQCRYHQVEAFRCLASGTMSDAAASIHAAIETSRVGAAPVQQWYSLLAESALSFTRGEWAAASKQADAAFDLGQRHGIRNAAGARVTHMFMELWLARQYEALGAIMVTAPPEVQETSLFEAGLGSALALSEGQRERGLQIATRAAVAACEEQRHPLSTTVAAIASEAMVGSEWGTEKLRSVVINELAPLEGVSVVGGSGFLHLGPASHYLANAATDPNQKRSLLQQAIAEADAAEQVTWQIALRAKLAALSADAAVLSEARAIAAQTELGDTLFAGQTGWAT